MVVKVIKQIKQTDRSRFFVLFIIIYAIFLHDIARFKVYTKLSPKIIVSCINLYDCKFLFFRDPSKSAIVECEFQGFVRRKTILKDGRKISLSSWQRYWLELSADVLVFYASKSFKGLVLSIII